MLYAVPAARYTVEEQGFTWDVFNGGFGLVNRWGVRKPVFNAFKLLNEAGNARLPVTGITIPIGGEGVVMFASKTLEGAVHLVLANHEGPAVNVTITLQQGGNSSMVKAGGAARATVARVDDTHANAYTAWVALGSPKADVNGVLDLKVVAALHKAAEIVEEPLELHCHGSSTALTLLMPHHGVARVLVQVK